MNQHKYDNQVGPGNAYGRSLELLRRHVGDSEGVHLDLACGLGPIARFVRDDLGLDYVGLDFDAESVRVLGERGFEAHWADLNDEDVHTFLVKILAGRPLASVSCLDGLEHLVSGEHLLAAISRLLAEHRALAVFSVPNVSHLDVAVKNLLGTWTYTDTGLLDRTHYQLFTATSLREAFRRHGLAVVDTADVTMARSDQHFPEDHGALSPTTPVNHWLREVRNRVEPHGFTNQFVWAVAPVPPVAVTQPDQGEDPFLTVVMRTQGRRVQELREALLCLAGQTRRDFEVLVVGHKISIEQQRDIERVIEDQPPSLRPRIRLILLDKGGRAAPLNFALEHARGHYVSIHDDDDLVLSNWVEDFAHHAALNPQRIIRGIAVKHPVDRITVRGLPAVKGRETYGDYYNRPFSLAEHLVINRSPTLAWAFPRTLFRDFGLRFDDSMSTTEDWAFLLQGAELVGVTDTKRTNAIYQWWDAAESSRTAHHADEWKQNHGEIERRMDTKPLLLPAGETRVLRKILTEHRHYEHEVKSLTRANRRLDARARRLEQRMNNRGDKLERLRAELRQQKRQTQQLRRRLEGPAPAGGASAGSRARAFLGRVARKLRLR